MDRSRNEALAGLVEEFGFTREELADEVNRIAERQQQGHGPASGERSSVCTGRHVRRWLSGEVRWPHTRYLLPLQEIFGRSGEALGFVPRSPGCAVPVPPQRQYRPGEADQQEVPVQRRSFLAVSLLSVLGLDCLPEHGRLGQSDLARIEGVLARLDAHFNGLGGGAVRDAACDLLSRLRHAAERCTYSDRIEAGLYRAMSAAAACGGWAAHDCGRPGQAVRLRQEALQAASLSGDRAAVTRAWSDLAVQAGHDRRPREAARITRTALQERHLRHSPRLTALLHARLADYQALEDPRCMGRHLAAAERAWDRVQGECADSWLAFLSPSELRGLGALAHQSAGRYQQAEELAFQARDLADEGYVRNRSYYTVLAGELQLAQGKREEAAATAASVEASRLDSARIAARLDRLTGALRGGPS